MKRPIPTVPTTPDPARRAFDQAVKENIDVLTGKQGGKIAPLETTANLADVIRKINEILGVLQ